jgi:hypothetical protein
MDHTQLVARALREAASAQATIAASYQRLWREENTEPADRADAEPSEQTESRPLPPSKE